MDDLQGENEDRGDEIHPGREVAVDRPHHPTPALAAIWRMGVSTPQVTNTSAAAVSSFCSL